MLMVRTARLTDPTAARRNFIFAAAALVALTAAALFPSNASAHSYNFGDSEELLEDLIEMDADDIRDLREDLIDARADVADAIEDIEEAKEEVKEVPMGAFIANIAFRTASATVSASTNIAFNKVRKELKKAEAELTDRREELGEAEFTETKGAIKMIREEITELEYALDDLQRALKAS